MGRLLITISSPGLHGAFASKPICCASKHPQSDSISGPTFLVDDQRTCAGELLRQALSVLPQGKSCTGQSQQAGLPEPDSVAGGCFPCLHFKASAGQLAPAAADPGKLLPRLAILPQEPMLSSSSQPEAASVPSADQVSAQDVLMLWVAGQQACSCSGLHAPICHRLRKRISCSRVMPQNSPLSAAEYTHLAGAALEIHAWTMPSGEAMHSYAMLSGQRRLCASQPGDSVARPGSPQSSRQQTRDDFSFCPHPQSSSRGSIDARLWASNRSGLQTPQLADEVWLRDLGSGL